MTKARDLANSAAAFSAVSATELGYVDGVTSAIQTQIDAKAASSTAVTLTGTQTLTNKTLTSPVIASVVNNTLTSTTGDIIYASAANTPARLAAGTSGYVLTSGGASTAPSWAAAAAGGMTLINQGGTALSGTTISISSIPATYLNLQVIIVNWRPTNDGVNLVLSVNGDTNANRHYKRIGFTQTDNTSFDGTVWDLTSGQDNGASSTNLTVVDIYNYANTTTWKLMQATTIANTGSTPTNFDYRVNMGGYNQTGAISSLQFSTAGNGNMTSGTVYVYGVK